MHTFHLKLVYFTSLLGFQFSVTFVYQLLLLLLLFLIGIHYARLNSHYEAWCYKKEKKAQKRLQATENLFRNNLQLKDIC